MVVNNNLMLKLLSFWFLIGNTLSQQQQQQNRIDYRLPTVVLPSHYDIEITPYFHNETVGREEFTFDGTTRITLKTTLTGVQQIVLHTDQLEIRSAILFEDRDSLTSIGIANFNYTDITQKQTLTLSSALRPNQDYILTFTYAGKISNDLHGLYRTSHVENGTLRWAGVTQMKYTYARRVFPCFDEPSFKATFNLTIIRPSHFQPSFANTRMATSMVEGLRIRETFHRTPRMSTYLLAFIISEFRIRENVPRTFGVISRQEAYTQTEYAYSIGQDVLATLENWTDIRYNAMGELEKLHMAAVPDFSGDTMENWGLLIFRESALLNDREVSTAWSQQKVTTNVVRAQTHLWFGNLVTCDWWNYLWLNDGFATFFEYFGTSMLRRNWDLNFQFIFDQLQPVFYDDSLETTHPMTQQTVETPLQINSMIPTINNNKAAVILRMIQHIMGEQNFQLGVQDYLKTNQYNTSTPKKLFDSLQTQTDQVNIEILMQTWATQPGYPMIMVERQDDKRSFVISQNRFFLCERNPNDNSRWELHLNYASNHLPNFTATSPMFSIRRDQRGIEIQMNQPTDWAIFNVQQTGYYRVNYDNNSWSDIAVALKNRSHSGIHVINRAQIVDDILNFAQAGYVDYIQAFNVVQYLEHEEHYLPWASAIKNLDYISRRLNGSDLVQFKKLFLKLSDHVYKKLGFTELQNNTRLDIYNRVNILLYNCKFGNADCIRTAKHEFAKMDTTALQVPPNLRPVVYCTGLADGGNGEWTFLWNKYINENVATERQLILKSLGCTRDTTIMKRYLDHILSDSLRLQDKKIALLSTLTHSEHTQTILDFIISHHERITNVFGSTKVIELLITKLASIFSTESQINQLESFFSTNNSTLGQSNKIQNAISIAKYNLKWTNQHVPIIHQYLMNATTNDGGKQIISTNQFTFIIFTVVSVLIKFIF